jgi:Domain of unknown function (DUF4132)
MITELSPLLLRKIHPRRAIAGSAKGPSKRTLASLRKHLAKRGPKQRLLVLREGIGKGPQPELAELQRSALAVVNDLSEAALVEAEIEQLVAASLLVQRAQDDGKQALVSSLVVTRGLADAIDMVLGTSAFKLGAGSGGWTTAVYLTTDGEPRRYPVGGFGLRHAICAASDEDYRAARTHAERRWPKLEPFDRVSVATWFPDEPWAAEVLAERLDAGDGADGRLTELATAAADVALLTRLCAEQPSTLRRHAIDIACGTEGDAALGLLADALPAMLVKPKYGPLLKTPPRDIVTAIGLMGTRAAAERLAPYLGDKVLGAVVTAFFRDHPDFADVLETHATGRGAKTAAARLAEQRQGSDDEGEIAADDDVPPLLRERPWRPKPGTKYVALVADADLPPDCEERVELPARLPEPDVERWREMTEEELASWRLSVQTGDSVDYDYDHKPHADERYLRVPEDEGLEAWKRGNCWTVEPILLWVAKHGLGAIDGLTKTDKLGWLDYEGADEHFAALCCFVSPRMAPKMATIAARRKKWRHRALSWLERHLDVVAIGLVVAACGSDRKPRVDAEDALTAMARRGHAERIRRDAGRCGREVMAIIEALLARDPLALEAKPPKMPAFLRLQELPPVRLANGARLGEEARAALVELLAVAPRDYSGLPMLKEACDEASLAAFAGGLLEQWLLGDAPGRSDWMLRAVAHFPSEASERRVAGLARQWARNKKAKAFRGCEALALFGSDRALMHLGHIAATSRFADLREDVRRMLEQAAAERGLSPEELADRTVPDLGLDEHGGLALSFGARGFVASLSPALEVVVRDDEGGKLRGLPRARKDDDKADAKAAKAAFAALKKDVIAIAQRQIRRFEDAMVSGRRFSAQDFARYVVRHPVLMHLGRGIVWEAADQTFRVAEDGTYADVEDESLILTSDAAVRVAHPARSPLAPWSAVLADYELIQPFEQVSRATFDPTAAERANNLVRRAEGTMIPARKILGLLEARGYARDDTGMVSAFLRELPGGVRAEIPLKPGFEIAYLTSSSDQTVGAARFLDGGSAVAVDAVDAVAFSELVRDLMHLAER